VIGRRLFVFLVLLSFLITACNTSSPIPSPTAIPALPFDQFVDRSFKDLLRRDPELGTILGVSAQLGMQDDQLTPVDDAYLRGTQELESQTLEELHRYNHLSLPQEQQRIYDTYEWYLDDLVRGHPYMYQNYYVSQMIDSPDQTLTQLFRDQQQVHTLQDVQTYIKRLGQINEKMDGVVAGLEKRRKAGVVLPAFLIDWTLSGIEPLASGDPKSSPFYTGFKQKLDPLSTITPKDQGDFLAEVERVIRNSVHLGFQKLADELNRLKKDAPQQIGIGTYPGGREYYAYLLRHHSSMEMSTGEIHQLGLEELQKIHAEMRTVFDQLGYPPAESLPALYGRVARESGFLSGSQVFDEFNSKIKEAKTDAAPFFNLYPKSDVVVQPDPIGGFYIPPALDGTRPGIFYAQTEGSIPYYIIPTLTYHETIPGHHTELALVGELGMPLFQSVAPFNGYMEGWALYAERLMAESGVYDNDPYGYLGYLQYAARRAARLVIDTGIHSQGWDFEKASGFMVENTGMSEREAQYEAARMAVMPGQAVSYYIGFMKIIELREKAKQELGDKFNIREFHDVVLITGPVPLSVLEDAVGEYISEKKAE
jgi:uncharacterized protein (DUF885 family)